MTCCAVLFVLDCAGPDREIRMYPSYPDPCLYASSSEMIKLVLDFEANNDNRLSLLDITQKKRKRLTMPCLL